MNATTVGVITTTRGYTDLFDSEAVNNLSVPRPTFIFQNNMKYKNRSSAGRDLLNHFGGFFLPRWGYMIRKKKGKKGSRSHTQVRIEG